jgi:hypothetical protein
LGESCTESQRTNAPFIALHQRKMTVEDCRWYD